MKRYFVNLKDYFYFLVLILISLFLISRGDSDKTDKVKSLSYLIFAYANEFFANVVFSTDLKRENHELRRRNAELYLELMKLRKYGVINSEYKNLLQVKDTTKYNLILGKVISKSNINNQENMIFRIEGRDSVKKGSPVINGYGLVGIVQDYSAGFIKVSGLKNIKMRLIVMNERNREEGILKWDGTKMFVDNIPKTADIKVGDRIITSDKSSLVDIPVLVGKVKKILNPDVGYFNILLIEPAVNTNYLAYVFVINSESHYDFSKFGLN